MAHTTKGRELTEAHRLRQVSLTGAVVAALRELFLDLFRPDDIDGSTEEFLRKALPLVMATRALSYDMATAYLEAFRRAELTGLVDEAELRALPGDPYAIDPDTLKLFMADDYVDFGGTRPADDLPDAGKITVELVSSTAAVAKRRIAKGDTPDEAKLKAAKAVSAKAVKHVADGGRAPLVAEVRTGNRGAVGYARVVDADPCPFCAMLASRGAVYRSDAFEGSSALFQGDNQFKVHDGCECTLEPVYGRRVTDLPPGSAELVQLWADKAAGRSDPFGYWRRYLESGTEPGDERVGAGDKVAPSARQYGRERARGNTKGKGGRKPVAELNNDELEQALKGMYVRRAGLERELAELEARGQSVTEPGPAQAIQRQLDRLERNIAHAQRRLGTI